MTRQPLIQAVLPTPQQAVAQITAAARLRYAHLLRGPNKPATAAKATAPRTAPSKPATKPGSRAAPAKRPAAASPDRFKHLNGVVPHQSRSVRAPTSSAATRSPARFAHLAGCNLPRAVAEARSIARQRRSEPTPDQRVQAAADFINAAYEKCCGTGRSGR